MQNFLYCLLIFLIYPLLGHADEQPLPVEQVFQLSAHYMPEQLQLHWQIAKGTYLYRDRIKIELQDSHSQQIATVHFPKGINKHSPVLGDFVAYENSLALHVPLASDKPATIAIQYQGCAKTGFCYPPQTRILQTNNQQITISNPEEPLTNNQQDRITRLLSSQNYPFILLGFLGFGLLLAFTPCVFPMVPILSGLIVGQKQQLTTGKAFRLSFAYVIAMAFTYAIAGVIAALAGSYVQALLQMPWVIALFSAVFVMLALSLFGVYDLQLPMSLQQRLINLSNQQQGGQYLGVFVMGSLSTLIVSPCVSAPLVGALGYIGHTGNTMLGGMALFMLGLGMGIPLLIIGTSAGRLLPKAGMWLELIKGFFGILLIGVAIGLLDRIIPYWFSISLWAIFTAGIGFYLFFYSRKLIRWQKFWQLIGLLFMCSAFILLLNNVLVVLNPSWDMLKITPARTSLEFTPINNISELTKALEQAEKAHQPIILDFYADWCVSCQKMERDILTEPTILQQLQHFKRLRADLTQFNKENKELMQSLHVIAPPTFVFFVKGQEVAPQRIVGDLDEESFKQHLTEVTRMLAD